MTCRGISVTVTRTRTIESSCEIEVSAADEESAEAKIAERIEKAEMKGEKALAALDFEESSDANEYEYTVSEA